ncbi:hypothetical protein BZA05DRAFT_316440, partial [Tricharina praecox]|uniref:uncharacterized protein n=1 Tax=Tricharina praecox TaxID=43433 RepID=UPI00221E64BD
MPCFSRRSKNPHPLRILLTNGRFPVTVDLARQLFLLSHTVFVADPMHYHVCKFSRAVKKSYFVPSPHIDAPGFISGIVAAVRDANIDLIIPMHEEIFYLAESKHPELLARMLAPPWETLMMLHNKWSFSEWLGSIGLRRPAAHLCRSREDVLRLLADTDTGEEADGWAVKPVFGRAASNVFHLRRGDEVPQECVDDMSQGAEYIAQEWLSGQRYCSYMVIRGGRVQAFSLYPVQDTIDGSSCVYFRSIAHPAIEEYVVAIAKNLPTVGAQLAFDFVETRSGEVMAFECNPRATSGIHLFSGTPLLAQALVSGPPAPPIPYHYTTFTIVPPQGAARQLAPGMMMWKRSERGVKAYLQHMKRLTGSKDVVFSSRDLMPSLMQPFLLTSYYEICRERGLALPVMFQWDLVWQP